MSSFLCLALHGASAGSSWTSLRVASCWYHYGAVDAPRSPWWGRRECSSCCLTTAPSVPSQHTTARLLFAYSLWDWFYYSRINKTGIAGEGERWQREDSQRNYRSLHRHIYSDIFALKCKLLGRHNGAMAPRLLHPVIAASPIFKVRFKMSNGAMYFVRAASLLRAGSTMTPWPCAEHLKRQHLCDKVWDRYVCYGGLCHWSSP